MTALTLVTIVTVGTSGTSGPDGISAILNAKQLFFSKQNVFFESLHFNYMVSLLQSILFKCTAEFSIRITLLHNTNDFQIMEGF